jgi:hypothetical protein
MRERPQTARARVLRRQRERRLEAPPVLLQLAELRAAVLQAEMQPVVQRIQRAVDREVLAEVMRPLVVSPTLVRLPQEMGPPPAGMLVQAPLPTTIPMTPAPSGPVPGARPGRGTIRRN